ncbi:tyrosine-type recombinase/integrase [Streptococcus suis]|uniref:Site-specific integrase n=1 Tax=Streptococcus suis TaxID=1307 RepID=A0A3Q8BII8_STRSU|nr:site-specific integrase [Streptococcus suis]ASW49029.1 integrase [Streptococcus suis]NQM47108.1 site-specific integrase [Streptococcus suis]HEL1780840.1 site-specific integrase [Streptococcus suis]HEM2811332.1 site-specific integrase [Streptococcus suis]HEM4289279.1 site-specific integrase [Streptococcus suis]
MKTETIIYKNKKVIKKTKNNGDINYVLRGVYLGLDEKTGKQVTTSITAKTLRQLDRKYTQAKLDFEQNGSTRKETITVTTLKELAEEWFKNYQSWVTSYNTLNRVRGYLDTYIIPRFGDYIPDKITSSEIQSWVNELADRAKKSVESGVKRAQKGRAKDFGAVAHKLSDIFDFGITNYDLLKNPALTIKIPPKPKANKKRIMVLHDEDLSHWLKFLSDLPDTRANRRFKVICNTLLASACRINELLALEIHDLDIETNEIVVNKTLMWKRANKKLGLKGEMVCKPTPKTDAGNRRIPVPNEIIVTLVNFHNEMNAYFEKHGLPKSDLIFPTIYGNYMCDRNERATLKKRLSSLGLPDYGFHLFRHTHASLMLNAGANWKELQIRLGHKSITTTMDTYAELAPKQKFRAVDIYLDKVSKLTA